MNLRPARALLRGLALMLAAAALAPMLAEPCVAAPQTPVGKPKPSKSPHVAKPKRQARAMPKWKMTALRGALRVSGVLGRRSAQPRASAGARVAHARPTLRPPSEAASRHAASARSSAVVPGSGAPPTRRPRSNAHTSGSRLSGQPARPTVSLTTSSSQSGSHYQAFPHKPSHVSQSERGYGPPPGPPQNQYSSLSLIREPGAPAGRPPSSATSGYGTLPQRPGSGHYDAAPPRRSNPPNEGGGIPARRSTSSRASRRISTTYDSLPPEMTANPQTTTLPWAIAQQMMRYGTVPKMPERPQPPATAGFHVTRKAGDR